MFERLYDVVEQSQVNFVGYVSDYANGKIDLALSQ